MQNIDLFEVNEAFAVVALTFIKSFDLDPEKVNVHGGWLLSGSGYVVDSLRAALVLNGVITVDGSGRAQSTSGHPVRSSTASTVDFEAVVRRAIALGEDTDTTACIAGGIAGLVVGEGGIPARWREALRGRELVEPLIAGLTQR